MNDFTNKSSITKKLKKRRILIPIFTSNRFWHVYQRNQFEVIRGHWIQHGYLKN